MCTQFHIHILYVCLHQIISVKVPDLSWQRLGVAVLVRRALEEVDTLARQLCTALVAEESSVQNLFGNVLR